MKGSNNLANLFSSNSPITEKTKPTPAKKPVIFQLADGLTAEFKVVAGEMKYQIKKDNEAKIALDKTTVSPELIGTELYNKILEEFNKIDQRDRESFVSSNLEQVKGLPIISSVMPKKAEAVKSATSFGNVDLESMTIEQRTEYQTELRNRIEQNQIDITKIQQLNNLEIKTSQLAKLESTISAFNENMKKIKIDSVDSNEFKNGSVDIMLEFTQGGIKCINKCSKEVRVYKWSTDQVDTEIFTGLTEDVIPAKDFRPKLMNFLFDKGLVTFDEIDALSKGESQKLQSQVQTTAKPKSIAELTPTELATKFNACKRLTEFTIPRKNITFPADKTHEDLFQQNLESQLKPLLQDLNKARALMEKKLNNTLSAEEETEFTNISKTFESITELFDKPGGILSVESLNTLQQHTLKDNISSIKSTEEFCNFMEKPNNRKDNKQPKTDYASVYSSIKKLINERQKIEQAYQILIQRPEQIESIKSAIKAYENSIKPKAIVNRSPISTDKNTEEKIRAEISEIAVSLNISSADSSKFVIPTESPKVRTKSKRVEMF